MGDDRECTCHPDEAPVPCQKKYAFTECEITRLREENARLREALKPFAELAENSDVSGFGDVELFIDVADLRAAAAAIQDGKTKHVP